MEEENINEPKSIKSQIEDLKKWKEEIEKNPAKKENKFSFIDAIVFLIPALVIGYFVWLFAGLTYAFIFGLIGGSIALFIKSYFFGKNWRPPFKYRTLGKKKKREGYIIVIKVGLNKAISFDKLPIDENVIMGKDGIPHVVKQEDILLWKNKIPMIIQPEWSLDAWSPNQHAAITERNGAGTNGWQYIINYIRKNSIKEKKEFKPATIIIGGIVVIGLIWYLIKSGAFS